ncbi:MAG: zinc-finger domain-containing protein [Gammaproteobacteria bacterium]|nr:zinc-finger domain-containing protein [Gammaproteobacteria bacterium]
MPSPNTAAENLKNSCSQAVYEVTEAELPIHCPLPGTSLWNSHPRVYIALDNATEAKCPYCGTLYKRVK